MSEGLEGARVLVLGASSGIGAATARAFAARGAAVVSASRGGERLEQAAGAIGARPVAIDIRDVDAVAAFFAGEAPFDHVVVSAARTRSGPVRALPIDEARAAMESKFWGAYHVARAARIAPGGSLTLVSGMLAHRPSAQAVLQGAINAALEALARGLALELAPVRVNCVSPGVIDTPVWDRLSDAERAALFARTAEKLPAGRIGTPDDVAAAIVALAVNPFATGSILLLDGGGAIA